MTAASRENLQRRLVDPDELASMALLLCSDAGSAITAQISNVDGGHMV